MFEGVSLGGTCVNVGCVPSKTLIRAAEAQHRRVHHAFRGIPATDGQPDWPTVRGEKDALVAELRQAKYWNVLRAYPSIDRKSTRLNSSHLVISYAVFCLKKKKKKKRITTVSQVEV